MRFARSAPRSGSWSATTTTSSRGSPRRRRVGGGTASTTVIVRAIGPSLTAEGVRGALQDPTLELYNSDGTLLSTNDNWRSDQETAIQNSTVPPSNDRESAIVATLAPGAYSAVVRGKNGTTGVALFEVYALGR